MRIYPEVKYEPALDVKPIKCTKASKNGSTYVMRTSSVKVNTKVSTFSTEFHAAFNSSIRITTLYLIIALKSSLYLAVRSEA